MKILVKASLFFVLLFIVNLSYAQGLPPSFERTLDSDNPEALRLSELGDIDNCFDYGSSNYTLLSLSAKFGAIHVMERLIGAGADLEAVCTGKTALLYAVKYGQYEQVQLLIESGANLEFENKGRDAFAYAKRYEQKDIYKYLKKVQAKKLKKKKKK